MADSCADFSKVANQQIIGTLQKSHCRIQRKKLWGRHAQKLPECNRVTVREGLENDQNWTITATLEQLPDKSASPVVMAAVAVIIGAEAPDDKDMARVRCWAVAQAFVNDSLTQVCTDCEVASAFCVEHAPTGRAGQPRSCYALEVRRLT